MVVWIIYLGEEGQDRIQTFDSRKSYIVDQENNIATRAKTLVVSASYRNEPESIVGSLLKNTQHMMAYFEEGAAPPS